MPSAQLPSGYIHENCLSLRFQTRPRTLFNDNLDAGWKMSRWNTEKARHSLRLSGYDYASPGTYFVTICQQQRECIFGEVKNGTMVLFQAGAIAAACWQDLANHYAHIRLDCFVVMPNHTHALIVIQNRNARHPLPEIVRGFKTFSARRINEQCYEPGTSVWQRSYHDYVVRSSDDLERIRKYLAENPLQWEQDKFYQPPHNR